MVDLVGPLLTQTLVRPLMVVVRTELVTQSLQFLDRLGRAVVGVEVLQGAVIPLQLAARLRVRRRPELPDFQRGEPLLEVHRLVASREMSWIPLSLMGCRGAPCSVIADSIARQAAVAVNRRGRRRADGEAGMSIENIDNPPQGFVGEDDLRCRRSATDR